MRAGGGGEEVTARETLRSYAALPPGWNSYGARPITAAAIDEATGILDYLEALEIAPPMPGPTNTGGVSLRWERGSRELCIEIPPEGRPRTFFRDDGEHAEEKPLETVEWLPYLVGWFNGSEPCPGESVL